MIRKDSVVNVLEPGEIKLGMVRLSTTLKFLLYQLHDVAPKCILADLYLHIDIPQTTVVTQFRKLVKEGYAVEEGINVNISRTAQTAEARPSPADNPERAQCKEMAELLAPALAAAYRMTTYNKYALAAILYRIHKEMNINITLLERASKWIAVHVNEPGFPVLHAPYMLFNRWGWLIDYKKRWDKKQVTAGKAYL